MRCFQIPEATVWQRGGDWARTDLPLGSESLYIGDDFLEFVIGSERISQSSLTGRRDQCTEPLDQPQNDQTAVYRARTTTFCKPSGELFYPDECAQFHPDSITSPIGSSVNFASALAIR